jgi:hypothetical protein
MATTLNHPPRRGYVHVPPAGLLATGVAGMVGAVAKAAVADMGQTSELVSAAVGLLTALCTGVFVFALVKAKADSAHKRLDEQYDRMNRQEDSISALNTTLGEFNNTMGGVRELLGEVRGAMAQSGYIKTRSTD